MLIGSAGKDVFVYYAGSGNETIVGYTEGEDIIQIVNGYISKSMLAGKQ